MFFILKITITIIVLFVINRKIKKISLYYILFVVIYSKTT